MLILLEIMISQILLYIN